MTHAVAVDAGRCKTYVQCVMANWSRQGPALDTARTAGEQAAANNPEWKPHQ